MINKKKDESLDMGAELESLDAAASSEEEPEEDSSPPVDQSGAGEIKALKLRCKALEDQNKNLQEQVSSGGVKVPKAKPGYFAVVHKGTKGDVSYFKNDIHDKPPEVTQFKDESAEVA